jgi:hypothetical protein
MSQVGHEDAKTTLNIYAQVLRTRDRSGASSAFDRLVADAVPSAPDAKIADLSARFEGDTGRRRAGQKPRSAR